VLPLGTNWFPSTGPATAPLTWLLHGVWRAANRDAGLSPPALDVDDLNAALGRPFLLCAVPGESDVERWAAYGQDAFLVEVGRLFGLAVREIHPPEAARGLERAAEFAQHFEASYLPLVLRALEHDKPVLAWTGPLDDPAQRARLRTAIEPRASARAVPPDGDGATVAPSTWVLIDRTATTGLGLAGVRLEPTGATDRQGVVGLTTVPVALSRPPIQLYVIEECRPVAPEPAVLLAAALEHARRLLAREFDTRFGVLTGPAALDEWSQRLRAKTPSEPAAQIHAGLAATVVAGARSGERFLQRQVTLAPAPERPLLTTLAGACAQLAEALADFAGPAGAAALTHASPAWTRFAEALATARAACLQMLTALQSWHARGPTQRP